MKYKGIELVPITKPQIFDPPKEMLVWDADSDKPKTKLVWGISSCAVHNLYRVHCDNGARYEYCAEIPQQQPKRATKLQLIEWLAKGNGLVRLTADDYTRTTVTAWEDTLEEEVDCRIRIRPFGTTEWLEPTLENMGMEE